MTTTQTPPKKKKHKNRRFDIRTGDPDWSQASHAVLGTQHRAMQFVIEGNFAMFTDIMSQPSSPVSYPIPTYGMIQQLLKRMAPRQKCAWIPLGVDILKAGELVPHSYNLTGPGRKGSHHKKGSNSQFGPTVLYKPSYRVYFVIQGEDKQGIQAAAQKAGNQVQNPHGHYYLGLKEFAADIRPATDEDNRDISQNFVLPVMLKRVCYDDPGRIEIFRDVKCINGRVIFPLQSQTIQATFS